MQINPKLQTIATFMGWTWRYCKPKMENRWYAPDGTNYLAPHNYLESEEELAKAIQKQDWTFHKAFNSECLTMAQKLNRPATTFSMDEWADVFINTIDALK
jgi:hypothetical protein